MKSEVYKQALMTLEVEKTHSDVTDDEDVCETCQTHDTMSLDTKNESGHLPYSPHTAEEAGQACSNCTTGSSGRRGEGRERQVAHHKLRWADDCKKELTRQHPRKRYVKRAAQPPPLKSILKGT